MAYNFFTTDPFNYNTQLALGGVYSGCGDLGEMLSTTARIVEATPRAGATSGPQPPSGWRRPPTAARGRSSGERPRGLPAGRAYYALALSSVDGTRDPSALLGRFPSAQALLRRLRGPLDPPGEPVEIPYEDLALPGYLFRPAGAPADRAPRSS